MHSSSQPPLPIFVGGVERSGTTLLGSLIGASPEVVCVPENQFLTFALRRSRSRVAYRRVRDHVKFKALWPELARDATIGDFVCDVGEMYQFLATRYGAAASKPDFNRWVDHTPTNLRFSKRLLEVFPEAKFVHIVRDGRAVAASLKAIDWGPNNMIRAADYWLSRLAFAFLAELELGAARVRRIYFEDLVSNPSTVLGELAGFLELQIPSGDSLEFGYSPSEYNSETHQLLSQAPSPTRIDAWQQALSAREVELFEQVAGEMLDALGYARVVDPASFRRVSTVERLSIEIAGQTRRARNRFKKKRRLKNATARRA